ncbi:MAG: ribulose-phosphate 3-epimerase [Armatimonadia bacterium]
MRNLLISTSMLSANFTVLGEEVKSLEAAGADWLHWDCMDGHFTDQLTHGPLVLKALRPLTTLFFDAHLMLTNPEPQIPLFVDAGADGISIHIETTDEPARLLDDIRARGCKSCLTVNPPTPLDDIERLLPHSDVIMLMGVIPGYAGQAYHPETTDRIRQVRALIDKAGLPTMIEVDGGVNGTTADEVIGAGADVLVSASFVFKHPEGYGGAIRRLREIAAGL